MISASIFHDVRVLYANCTNLLACFQPQFKDSRFLSACFGFGLEQGSVSQEMFLQQALGNPKSESSDMLDDIEVEKEGFSAAERRERAASGAAQERENLGELTYVTSQQNYL